MNAFKDYKLLGKNVKQIVCVFAEDERSLAFKARMPRFASSTKYYTTYMPGRHGTLVGNANTSAAEVKVRGVYLLALGSLPETSWKRY